MPEIMLGEENIQNYMGYQWLMVEGDTVLVGVTEEGLEEFDGISAVDLPQEAEEVAADEVCGCLETSDGPLDIYSPLDGEVIEINPAVLENASVVFEDPTGEGWLFKIQSDNIDELKVARDNDDD